MKPGIVDRVLYSYRIGGPAGKYPIYDDEGARMFPGRWNTTNSPMLYSSEHYATALLEKLAHFNGVLPDNQHRSEEHTSELQSLMRISYAVFCLKKKSKRKANAHRIGKAIILALRD